MLAFGCHSNIAFSILKNEWVNVSFIADDGQSHYSVLSGSAAKNTASSWMCQKVSQLIILNLLESVAYTG